LYFQSLYFFQPYGFIFLFSCYVFFSQLSLLFIGSFELISYISFSISLAAIVISLYLFIIIDYFVGINLLILYFYYLILQYNRLNKKYNSPNFIGIKKAKLL
ncbi:hypothetical protein, partial [Aliarcobacter butzleri]|uniref:hypothetical protein n=1 Tax=Aliarcobacter butzleri TaxID=28197 RepID=UPI003B20FAD4